MVAPREIELKLECEGSDLAELSRHPFLQAEGSEDSRFLTSTYFDTAAGDLRAAGLTLRVRRDRETFVQTVKAAATALGSAYRLQLGKAVGEIVPASATKGHAIRALAENPPYAGRRAIFLGDDLTDEKAFAVINETGGVSVRIGGAETIASRRLIDPEDVRRLLYAWADGAQIDPDALPAA